MIQSLSPASPAPGSIAIIGAGVAGLAAGCYAQMNGYSSEIFELHELPGGLCTSWERKDFVFDGCIHYLLGSGAGQPFHSMWRELGAVQDRRMISLDEFMRVTDKGGESLILYTDPDRLQAHMLKLSPSDGRPIRAFCAGVRKFRGFDMYALKESPEPVFERFRDPRQAAQLGRRLLPFLPPMMRWAFISAEEFGRQFRHPLLQRAWPLLFGWPEIPVMAAMAQLAAMHCGNAAFPAGGSLAFARALEQRYLSLGGSIRYNAQVDRIRVENGRAVGVRLYNDEIHLAERVISAADGKGTIFDWLSGKYVSPEIESNYDGHLPIRSQVHVSFGVDRDLSSEPHWVTYLLDQPITIGGEDRFEIGVKHYCFDPSLAPGGKSVVQIMLPASYEYWQRIYGRKLYDTEQNQVADILIDFLESRYPGFRRQVEVIDVATPLSFERYTGNWHGSVSGWILSPETMRLLLRGIPKTLPGLDGLFMAGQWVEPGGMVPMAAVSGRNVIQMICSQDDRRFRALEP
jgi:phytoene dehydrogenase-like protein